MLVNLILVSLFVPLTCPAPIRSLSASLPGVRARLDLLQLLRVAVGAELRADDRRRGGRLHLPLQSPGGARRRAVGHRLLLPAGVAFF